MVTPGSPKDFEGHLLFSASLCRIIVVFFGSLVPKIRRHAKMSSLHHHLGRVESLVGNDCYDFPLTPHSLEFHHCVDCHGRGSSPRIWCRSRETLCCHTCAASRPLARPVIDQCLHIGRPAEAYTTPGQLQPLAFH